MLWPFRRRNQSCFSIIVCMFAIVDVVAARSFHSIVLVVVMAFSSFPGNLEANELLAFCLTWSIYLFVLNEL